MRSSFRYSPAPGHARDFSPDAHHHGSLPQQLGLVCDLLLKADPEGSTLIFHAALQHGFHSTFYSFRASAAHMLSLYLLNMIGNETVRGLPSDRIDAKGEAQGRKGGRPSARQTLSPDLRLFEVDSPRTTRTGATTRSWRRVEQISPHRCASAT